MEIELIKKLAEEFGIPCIERQDSLTLIGEQQLLIFNKAEETQCQLTEIY